MQKSCLQSQGIARKEPVFVATFPDDGNLKFGFDRCLRAVVQPFEGILSMDSCRWTIPLRFFQLLQRAITNPGGRENARPVPKGAGQIAATKPSFLLVGRFCRGRPFYGRAAVVAAGARPESASDSSTISLSHSTVIPRRTLSDAAQSPS